MKLLLVVANVLLPISVLIFATGFFPHKPFIPGLATHQDLQADLGNPPPPQYDRLVFMVIDALRSDFVFSSASGFSFTQK
jgi:ethanolamine phosphate transferase 2 subunit G